MSLDQPVDGCLYTRLPPVAIWAPRFVKRFLHAASLGELASGFDEQPFHGMPEAF